MPAGTAPRHRNWVVALVARDAVPTLTNWRTGNHPVPRSGVERAAFRGAARLKAGRRFRARLAAKVLPAAGLKFLEPAVLGADPDGPGARDPTDFGHRYSLDLAGDFLASGHGELQFVVLAPVQRKIKVDFAAGLADMCSGDRRGINLRAHAALFADVSQIGRETIARINHRAGQLFLA